MADLIPFPRLLCDTDPAGLKNPQAIASAVHALRPRGPGRCANGMPGHPPCRSPAELEAMLRARADTTAAREDERETQR